MSNDIPSLETGVRSTYTLQSCSNTLAVAVQKSSELKNKVSIVLPTYNRAHMLTKCIENILNQTHKNIELIIVNDASTDKTKQILMQYTTDPRIILIQHEHNQGTPGALNSGFKKSTGNYLTWTSDDNFLHPEFCSRLIDTFIQNSSIHYLYCNYMVFQNTINDRNITIKPLYTSKLDFLINFQGAAGFMWTREVYERVGDFDINLFGIEDWDYLLRIIFNDLKYQKLNETLYYYRSHTDSITQQIIKTPKYLELHRKTCEKFVKSFPEIFIQKDAMRKKISAGKNVPVVKLLLACLSD